MIAKGIISAIDANANKVSVILPEYNGVVSAPLGIYGNTNVASLSINEFVMVVFFNNDLTDGLVFLSAAELQAAINVIDNLTSVSKVDALSANQGNVLHKMIVALQNDLSDEAITNIELEAILK